MDRLIRIINEEIKETWRANTVIAPTLKKILLEEIETLFESKQTEQQALNTMLSGGVVEKQAQHYVNVFKSFDTTKNQILLPVIAKIYVDNKSHIGLEDLNQLFTSVSEMVNANKLNVPQVTKDGYMVNGKTFPDYLKFAEFVHGLEGMAKGHAEWKGKINVDVKEPPIWEGNGIKIYDGNDVGKCIHYTTGALTGKRYGFCIGQPANSMWQSYRDTKTSTFYYVIDATLDLSDPLHIVVVDNTQHGIELTDANNTTGNIGKFGRDVNAYLKFLQSKGVPTDKIFLNKPKTPEEQKEKEKLGQQNRSLEWFKGLSFDEKSKYVGRGHILSDEQFEYLWQFKNDKGGFHLLHQYVDTGQPIPEKQFDILVGEGE